jgi:hypothetical protein
MLIEVAYAIERMRPPGETDIKCRTGSAATVPARTTSAPLCELPNRTGEARAAGGCVQAADAKLEAVGFGPTRSDREAALQHATKEPPPE